MAERWATLRDNDRLRLSDRLKHDVRTAHIPIHILSGHENNRRGFTLGAMTCLEKDPSKESLDTLGLGFGDVVAMTVYLVGDPSKGGKMDFEGFMGAYTQFFGTKEQPNLPARSTVQVAGLAGPGMMVEIEVQLAK